MFFCMHTTYLHEFYTIHSFYIVSFYNIIKSICVDSDTTITPSCIFKTKVEDGKVENRRKQRRRV